MSHKFSRIIGYAPLPISSITFLGDDDSLATAGGKLSERGQLMIWNASQLGRPKTPTESHHANFVVYAAGALATSGNDGHVRIWDLDRLVTTHIFKVPGDDATCVALDRARRYVAAGWTEFFDSGVTVWRLDTGAEVARIEVREDDVVDLAFAPSGDFLVSATVDSHIGIWETNHWQRTGCFQAFEDGAAGIAFVRDDVVIGGSGFGSNLCVWNPKNLSLLHDGGHHKGIVAIAASPDGRYFATSSGEGGGSVTIYDACTRSPLANLKWSGAQINAVAFSPSGSYIAYGGEEGKLHLWQWDH